MGPAGTKDKHLSSVNHTTKAIHHHQNTPFLKYFLAELLSRLYVAEV